MRLFTLYTLTQHLHLILLVLPSSSAAPTVSVHGPRVRLTTGLIEGFYNGSMEVFLGIPYAQPPLDDLRFRAPQPPLGHAASGVLATKTWSDACFQSPPVNYVFQNEKFSEDCLYLNVWRPRGARGLSKPLPVLIHGGAFIIGAASQGLYIPYSLMRTATSLDQPIIVVTLNHRLNSLGFLASPEMPAEDINAGLLDQVAALRFIHANVGAFGGDPRKVTLWGQSSGSVSIAYHTLFGNYPEHLFRATVMTSGNHLNFPIQSPALATLPTGSLTALLSATGCTNLVCLRKASLADLGPATIDFINNLSGAGTAFGFPPVKGGYIAERPSLRLANTNRAGMYPSIMTTVTDEGTLFTPVTVTSLYQGDILLTAKLSNPSSVHPSTFQQLDLLYPINSSKLLSPFEPREPLVVSKDWSRGAALINDCQYLSPRRAWMAAAVTRGKERARQWSYRFDQQNPAYAAALGAFHASDLYLLWGQIKQTNDSVLDAQLRDLSLTMQTTLINFVYFMDPSARDFATKSINWEPYKTSNRIWKVTVGKKMEMEDDAFRAKRTKFFATLNEQLQR